MSIRVTCAFALVALALPCGAQAQRIALRGSNVHIESPRGSVDFQLPCRPTQSVLVRDRYYVGTRCGVFRLELSPEGLRRVHRGLPDQVIDGLRVMGDNVEARARLSLRWVAIERVDAVGEFEDPSEPAYRTQLATEGLPLEVRVATIHGPPIFDPPRQADRWEIAGSVLAFPTTNTSGLGVISRARVTYRAPFEMMFQADLAPLSLSFGDDAFIGGAQALLTTGLDTQLFAAALTGGVVSNNDHAWGNTDPLRNVPIEPGQLFVLGPYVRIGAADGVRVILSAAAAFSPQNARLGFFEADLQIPLAREWAITGLFAYSLAGNIEARGGVRAWLNGYGGAGSLALRIDAGFAQVSYHGPSRARGYPADGSHIGPGVGVGLEARF